MRFNALSALFFVVFLGFSLSISGCQEANKPDDRRSRLLADDNLQLKKQLELRNQEIKKQRGLLTECEKKAAAVKQISDEAATSMLDMLTDVTQKNENLTEENKQLKASVKNLEEKIAQSASNQGQSD